MSDDPILAALARMEIKLTATIKEQDRTLHYGLEQIALKLRAEMADGQAGILGTINGWMERLRDDQKAALGHATMAFTAAQGNSRTSKLSCNYSTNFRSASWTSRNGCGRTSTDRTRRDEPITPRGVGGAIRGEAGHLHQAHLQSDRGATSDR